MRVELIVRGGSDGEFATTSLSPGTNPVASEEVRGINPDEGRCIANSSFRENGEYGEVYKRRKMDDPPRRRYVRRVREGWAKVKGMEKFGRGLKLDLGRGRNVE